MLQIWKLLIVPETARQLSKFLYFLHYLVPIFYDEVHSEMKYLYT